jgi:hypothetical protein
MARLDTGWHAHPKIMSLSLAAMGLHAWSISYCDYARTDGFVPASCWPAKAGVAAAVDALVKAGLWEIVEGGYQLHDYVVYNRTKAQIEADQSATNDRKERWKQRRSESVPASVPNGVALARAGAPGPGPGPVGTVDLLKNGSDTSAGVGVGDGADGAPPRASPPHAQDSDALRVRCPRCERTMLVDDVEDHPCELVPGEPVHPSRRPPAAGNLGGFLRRPPAAPPPAIAAQFAAMHERVQSIPEANA